MTKRTLVAMVTGSVIVAAMIAMVEFRLRRPVGDGPAGPKVSDAPFDGVWTDRTVQLVGIGDSVTRGLGALTTAHSYFQRLIKNPPDEWSDMRGKCLSAVLPNLQTTNLAVSGSTSPMHLDVIENDLPSYPDDVFGLVVMTTGGNDLIHSYGRLPPREAAMFGATLQQALPWIDRFEARLNQMLQRTIDRFPGGCEIYLADIYDPTDGVGDGASVFLPAWPDGLEIHSRYNEVIRRAADRKASVHLVPLHETFLGHGSHCRQFWRSTYDASDPHYWFWDNIEDPNTRGYDAIRRVFLNEIVRNTSLRMESNAQSLVSEG
ncbi:SGNH/GDSL hydrolase family protein [Crateriforma conspicua]|uniref:SGNH hydrolase-type esterase domain-containing protein n=1 Tax=Crateriforma conspicua TaxID=2527996 RepID=A0A5C6FX32_9PLAN|nr:SGNH/GDSL hydrolase family protein [Crateriforma conspicua]TWU67547.1 hypothetical protein V7x_31210 [Crateriforma conspicua]